MTACATLFGPPPTEQTPPPACEWPGPLTLPDQDEGLYQLAPKNPRPVVTPTLKEALSSIKANNEELDTYNRTVVPNIKAARRKDEDAVKAHNESTAKLKASCQRIIDDWVKG